MSRRLRLTRVCVRWGIAVLLGGLFASPSFGQGFIMSTSGPINQSMGGAAVAAPLDSIGALYWNPATISGLEYSEMAFGLDIIMPYHEVSSSFGPFAGTTEAEPGVVPLPSIGWVHHTANPAITVGLGVSGVAGFKTNLGPDPTNPVLAPPALGGLGQVSSEACFMQITPAISVALTDSLSVGVGPVIALGKIGLDPFVFNSPNANGVYPSAWSSTYHWGAGVQAGVYYIHNCCWRFGAAVKSPTWMEEFRFYAEDANGAPRMLRADIDLPLILSLGTSYAGFEHWLFALDVRYFDYKNTRGFGDPAVFSRTGALQGLDYSSVVAVATGVQYQFTDALSLRGGYTYNQNPVQNAEAFFNIASPLIYQHMLSFGGSYLLNDWVSVNLAYSYMLPQTRTGPLVHPQIGAIPGSSLSNTASAHQFNFGLGVKY